MIISYSKNFVYVHLEKTGGTSVEFALEPFLSSNDKKIDMVVGSTPNGEALEDTLKMKYGEKNLIYKHSSSQEAKEFLGDQWDNMYKFSTVRDPHDLMISLYYYSETILARFINSIDKETIVDFFMNKPRHPVVTIWAKEMPYMIDYFRSWYYENGIDGFIQSILLGKGHHKMKTQYERLEKSVEIFDLSNLSNDWATIQQKTGIFEAELRHENKSQKPEKVVLSDETIRCILDFFKEDYENIPGRTGISWKHSLI